MTSRRNDEIRMTNDEWEVSSFDIRNSNFVILSWSLAIWVRLEKVFDVFAGESPVRQGSFQPVATGGVVEVTKPPESLV
jgi:hypothetical protein